MRQGAALLLAIGIGWSSAANAQVPPVLAQKERFVSQLLSDSPMMRRIEASGNVQAKELLDTAVKQYRAAQDHMREGRIAEAETALNEAIWSAGRARQLAPDSMKRMIGERVRYASLLAGVESLLKSYTRHLARQQHLQAGETPVDDDQSERAKALIEDAKELLNSEAILEANRALASAESGLLLALTRMLGSATIRYTETFDTPEAEFAYEMQRNTSYSDLVPVAMREYRSSSEQIVRVSRRVEHNQALREQAYREAARKDWRAALRTIRSGNAELERALAETGLVIPREARSGRSD